MSLRVLALDPGERVGWATATIFEGHGADHGPSLEVDKHGIAFLKDMALKLHSVVKEYDVVIYETWRLRPNKAKAFIGNEFLSSQFIGMVRLCCWLSPKTKMVAQGPSTKSTAARYVAAHQPVIQTKLDGMPSNHDDGHDGDALLHLAHFYLKNYA